MSVSQQINSESRRREFLVKFYVDVRRLTGSSSDCILVEFCITSQIRKCSKGTFAIAGTIGVGSGWGDMQGM